MQTEKPEQVNTRHKAVTHDTAVLIKLGCDPNLGSLNLGQLVGRNIARNGIVIKKIRVCKTIFYVEKHNFVTRSWR